MKQLIPFTLFVLLFSYGAQAQQRFPLKVEEGSILSKNEKVGSYDIIMDTLKIVKFEEFNIDNLIPEMIVSKKSGSDNSKNTSVKVHFSVKVPLGIWRYIFRSRRKHRLPDKILI